MQILYHYLIWYQKYNNQSYFIHLQYAIFLFDLQHYYLYKDSITELPQNLTVFDAVLKKILKSITYLYLLFTHIWSPKHWYFHPTPNTACCAFRPWFAFLWDICKTSLSHLCMATWLSYLEKKMMFKRRILMQNLKTYTKSFVTIKHVYIIW